MSNPREKQRLQFTNLIGEDVCYTCTPFGAKRSVALLPKVMRLVSTLGHLLDSVDNVDDLQNSDLKGAALSHAVVALANFIEEEGSDFIIDLLVNTYRKGPGDNDYQGITGSYFSEAYKANLTELARALFFALKTNYAGFLGKLGEDRSLVDVLQERVASIQGLKDSQKSQA